ncbi:MULTISPECIES: hypothetical protein [unclassified Vibrio]|uniref:hypothetical protein n=1 Tax=unclassified Vibrio TaxID=2614977 RepID=UPI001056CB6C|nr:MULTISPECIES: hypothetical protein [unclassified Vibrio]
MEHVHPNYACRQCDQTKDNSHIAQKPTPINLISQSIAAKACLTASANIIFGKYKHTILLYYQESSFAQSGTSYPPPSLL